MSSEISAASFCDAGLPKLFTGWPETSRPAAVHIRCTCLFDLCLVKEMNGNVYPGINTFFLKYLIHLMDRSNIICHESIYQEEKKARSFELNTINVSKLSTVKILQGTIHLCVFMYLLMGSYCVCPMQHDSHLV